MDLTLAAVSGLLGRVEEKTSVRRSKQGRLHTAARSYLSTGPVCEEAGGLRMPTIITESKYTKWACVYGKCLVFLPAWSEV